MVTSPRRWVPAVLGLVVLGTAAVLLGPRARAEDAPSAPKVPEAWVYDIRVVRVDPSDPAVVETAPTWKPAGATGASTTATWADLLGGLKARGATTILLDQRVTTVAGVATEFKQQRRRPVLSLRNRAANAETWETMYIETGTSGQLVSTAHGLQYMIDVSWEEAPKEDGTGPVGNVSWKGTRSGGATVETLVLSHRQQVAGSTGQRGLEIYVFITGTPDSAR